VCSSDLKKIMKVILFLAFVAVVLGSNIHPEFLEYVAKYNKAYHNDAEFLKRMEIYRENMALAAVWNHKGTARFGATEFADMTPQEFAEQRLMTSLPPYERPEELVLPRVEAPTSFDWRKTPNAVSAVKNQGQCGSCWAFSATENVESVNGIKSGNLPILAPQQVVDCDKEWYGCSGGWPYGAFKYLAGFGGQDSEASYPYTAADGDCNANTANIIGKIDGYNSISTDEKQIQESLATVAPLSICVDASQWYLYQGGVITSDQCGNSIDHCVQLVGYDATANPQYWIVRNSWGTSWGENGYLRLQMFKDTCAMADAVTTAYIK